MPEEATTPVLRCADPECGVEFVPYKPGQKYHSPKCRKRHWLARRGGRRLVPAAALTLACPRCGEKLSALVQLCSAD